MKIHVRAGSRGDAIYYALCNHNTKNGIGFVMLQCMKPAEFISLLACDRCKHCEKRLNLRRARKGLSKIDWKP